MRVLLIEPPFSESQAYIMGFGLAEPLSLEMLAGNLRHHDVRILDMRLDPDLPGALAEHRPDVVGTGCYVTGVAVVRALMRQVRTLCPQALTVVGGHHASLVPGDFADANIDVVVVGEGEHTLRELVDAHEQRRDFAPIAGLALKTPAGGLALTPPRPLADLEALPLPDRRLVEPHRQRYFRGAWRPIVSVSTERGCPYRCRFCSMWKVNQGRYRVRSPEAVVREIAALAPPYIDFIDDNTLHDVQRARRIAELLKQAGIRKSYKAYARSDTIVKHPDLVEQWRDIGMRIALVGFESFRDSDMAAYGKHNTVQNNEQAMRILQANGVEIAAYFVINPDYTRDDFRRLGDYVAKWQLSNPVFTVLTPFPGTDLYRDVYDRLLTHDHELYDFCHALVPTTLPLPEFQREFYELWRRAYSLPSALKRLARGRGGFSLSGARSFRRFMRGLKAAATERGSAPARGAAAA